MQYLKFLFGTFLLLSVFNTTLMGQKKNLPCLNKEFNVVANIVMTEADTPAVSADSIFGVMEKVNALFEPICVSFKICTLDTIANFRYDSVSRTDWEEMQVIYHQQRKINMFWVSQFDFDSTLCGVSELLGIANTENGGILMLGGDCVNEFAIAHELGRFFGIPYTFGEGIERTAELVRQENCAETGDLFCDTPADPYKLGPYLPAFKNKNN